MATGWKANLEDLDDQGLGPSAASPLAAAGLDPDVVRANLAAMNSPIDPSESAIKKPAAAKPSGPMAAMPAGASESAKAAGAAGGAAAPSAPSEEPVPASADTPYAEAMGGLKNLGQAQTMANTAAEEVPTQDPEISRLAAQRSKLAAPVDLYDPTTGKMKPQAQVYNPETGEMDTVNAKPSTGRKIWRGVRGGLVGLLEGGIPGAGLGAIDPSLFGQEKYGAPTEQLQRDEQRNAQALESTDKSLGNEFQNWKDQVDAAKAKSTELRTNAQIGRDQVTGATGVMNAQSAQERAHNESPAAKNQAALQLHADEFAQRTTQADGMKLSPLNKLLYILNGKVPDPREPNAAEIDAAAAARALTVFKAQHNGQGPKTLDDFNAIQASARGTLKAPKGEGATDQQLKQINDKKADGIERANTDFAKNPYSASARAEYQRQLQEVQDAYEADASVFDVAGPHMVVSVDPKGQPKWTPQTAAPAPAQTAQAQLPTGPAPAGATGYVLNRKTGVYHWTDGKKDLGEAK